MTKIPEKPLRWGYGRARRQHLYDADGKNLNSACGHNYAGDLGIQFGKLTARPQCKYCLKLQRDICNQICRDALRPLFKVVAGQLAGAFKPGAVAGKATTGGIFNGRR